MGTISSLNDRRDEIEKMTYSQLSHVVLEVREAIIQAVESSIPSASDNIVFLLGPTKAGKSTAMCFLRGDKMLLKPAPENCYESQSDRNRVIGHSDTASCTFLPSVEAVRNLVLVDFPGFDDTNGQLISLGMEFALKALIKKYQPKVLLLQSITEKERGFKAAAELGSRLGRLFANKEHCFVGITKYSQDNDFREIKAVEELQKRDRLASLAQEEGSLNAQMSAFTTTLPLLPDGAAKSDIEGRIAGIQQKLAELAQKRTEVQQQALPLTAQKTAILDHLAATENQLLLQIGIDRQRIIRFSDLDDPNHLAACHATFAQIPSAEYIRVPFERLLDPDDGDLLEKQFTNNLEKMIEEKDDYFTDFETFKQAILRSSVIATVFARSNPEIGQFLHLPEIDPRIVWGYDQRIVSTCIDQHIDYYIGSFNLSIFQKILKQVGENTTFKQTGDLFISELKKLRDYILIHKGIQVEDEQKAERDWIKLQKELRDKVLIRNGISYKSEEEAEQAYLKHQQQQQKATNDIAEAYDEPRGWSYWLTGGIIKQGIRTLFMWRDQSNAIREINQKKIEEYIEEVHQMHLALERLNEIEKIIKEQDVSAADPKLRPSWINANHYVPLRELGLFDLDLVAFIKKYGTQLKCLNLMGQRIDGEQLRQLLSYCPHLTKISINSDKITDDDLEVLKGRSLISVNLLGCLNLTDNALMHLKGMPLKDVGIFMCNLTDNALAHLKGMPLTNVSFGGCHNLTDNALVHLKGMALTCVAFQGCENITDNALAHLSGMPLTYVNFSRCHYLTDNALANLEGMPLTSVNFSRCYCLTDNALAHLKRMDLTQVDFGFCQKLTDNAIVHLKEMPLTSIDFTGCTKLTSNALALLNRMPLTSVNFSGCDNLTDNALSHLKGMPLKIVFFNGCKNLTDNALAHLIRMPLTAVSFGGCKNLTDNALAHLKGMPLTAVYLDGCKKLTNIALTHLKEMPLTIVSFSHCVNLTDNAFVHLKGMPLTAVSFSGCKNLTDNALAHLKGMPLTNIDFGHCGNLTDNALAHLKGMPLTSVNFFFCSNLTDNALAHLKGMPLSGVNFGRCKKLTNYALMNLKAMPLTGVNFSECHNLTDNALAYLKGMSLTSVDFFSCINLTDNALAHLEGMPLIGVDFSSCSNLTDNALEHLKRMPLTSVNFHSCENITDNALSHLKGMLLTHVGFGKCKNLTDNALAHLKGMPLTSVDFSNCKKLTDQALTHLKGMPLKNVNFEGCKITQDGLVSLKLNDLFN